MLPVLTVPAAIRSWKILLYKSHSVRFIDIESCCVPIQSIALWVVPKEKEVPFTSASKDKYVV